MALDLLSGLAQGFVQGQQARLAQEEKREQRKLKEKLFKRQLDMLEEQDVAKQKLFQLLSPALKQIPAADDEPAAQVKLPGKSLLDVLSDPEGQMLALQSGMMKPTDIKNFQQPDVGALIKSIQAAAPNLEIQDVLVQDGKAVPKLGPSAYSQALAKERAKADVAEEIEAAKLRGKGELTEFEKKIQKAKNVTELIGQAEALLDDASGSLLGTALSFGKRSAGVSDKTTQANQKLKLLSGWLVSNVPRMEGPQSEFDVKNYQEMAGMVGDSTVPAEDRRAALKVLLELQQKYGGMNKSEDKPSLKGPGKQSDPLGIR